MTSITKNRIADFLLGNLLTVLIMAGTVIYINGQKDQKSIDLDSQMTTVLQDLKTNTNDHDDIKTTVGTIRTDVAEIKTNIEWLKREKETNYNTSIIGN